MTRNLWSPGDQYKEIFPAIAVVARTSRAFLTRAVRYLAAEAGMQAQQGYNDSGAVPYYLRGPEQFERYFEGLELVEPGVVPMVQWRPDPDTEQAPIYSYCGVGRKP
jgi:S-adenosyl methyltransferase